MALSPLAHVLWTRIMRYDAAAPDWPDRDRFVLSAGHASILLYAMLHLTGYDLTLDDLKAFRQWDSKTPGHPEHGLAPGVETTTGPLGQGVGNAVGLAIAEAHLAARFNRPGHTVVDHFTYVLAGDGDMMEGVAQESVSLAGHLGLGKLVCLYDANRISLAAATDVAFTQDVGRSFEGAGWHVVHVDDGNDTGAIDAALSKAKAATDRPSLVVVRSHIGFGSPKQDTFGVHGSPLDAEEVKATKKRLGYPSTEPFFLPENAVAHMRTAVDRGAKLEAEWKKRFEAYRKAHPEPAAEFERALAGRLPEGWDADIPSFSPKDKPLATRVAGSKVLGAIAARVPELVGGSADLNPSTNTTIKGGGDFERPLLDGDRQGAVGGDWGYGGRNLHFGVREHAMGAIASGLALHGGLRPYTATFLTFSDYMRPAMRLGALMELPVVYVFTHDSIGLGEDGPTHQPVEHAAALRAIPNMTVLRPADANETAAAWRFAMTHRHGPTVLLLTRQGVRILDGPADVARGGYVLVDSEGPPEVLLMASGSEVGVALEARDILAGEGRRVRVVSMPSPDLFLLQDEAYRDSVLPPGVLARVAIEAGVPLGWDRLVGPLGAVVAIENRFGASAPIKVIMEKYGFTGPQVAARARALLADLPARARTLGQALAALDR